jgi:hypothetical protein
VRLPANLYFTPYQIFTTFQSMKKLLLLAATVFVVNQVQAQGYVPVALTGFNADVVADGTGDAATVTSHDFDSAAFNLVAQNYTTPSGQSPTSYLPASGLITSAVSTTPGLTYQLAPYSGNNSLRISGSGTGTLTFTTPRAATQVFLLAASGSGISNATATVTFSDATTQSFTLTVSDWYNGSDFAIQGISRVKRTTNVLENSALNPRLYQHQLNISTANAGKSIGSISFTKLNPAAVLNVMGITIRATVTGTDDELASSNVLTAYPNPVNEHCTVRITSPATGNALLQLTDVTGRTVMTKQNMLQPGETLVPLELIDHPAGVYLLSIETAHATRYLKLVKE